MTRLSGLAAISAMLVALAGPAQGARSGNFEQDVLAELNFVRTQPQRYAQELARYREDFDGRLVHGSDPTGDIMTREGVKAVDEAIRFLDVQPALPPLEMGATLSRAASDLVDEQGERGETGHVSPGGLTPNQRVQRRGGGPYVGETISYGSLSPAAVVRQLIVDDGVADRGHRKLIFTARLRFAGVGCGPHPVYRFMCVVDYGVTADGAPQAAGTSAASR